MFMFLDVSMSMSMRAGYRLRQGLVTIGRIGTRYGSRNTQVAMFSTILLYTTCHKRCFISSHKRISDLTWNGTPCVSDGMPSPRHCPSGLGWPQAQR
jgi:hypothetical protein